MAQFKTFLSKWSPFLFKFLIAILVLVVVIMAGLLLRATVFEKQMTPRTAAERATMDAEAAVAKDPRGGQARLDLGIAYAMVGRYGAALRELRIAIQLKPGLNRAYYSIGVVYKEMKNLPMAVQYLKRAAEMKGEYADFYARAYYELGQAYFAQKNYKEAVKAFQKAEGFAPMASDIKYDLGRAYEKAGQKQDALIAYDFAFQYDPENKAAAKALERLKADLEKKKEK